jgi:hypothetical protein
MKVMGFSLRQVFNAGVAAATAAATVAQFNAHNPATIGLALVAGLDIITAGLTYSQP